MQTYITHSHIKNGSFMLKREMLSEDGQTGREILAESDCDALDYMDAIGIAMVTVDGVMCVCVFFSLSLVCKCYCCATGHIPLSAVNISPAYTAIWPLFFSLFLNFSSIFCHVSKSDRDFYAV